MKLSPFIFTGLFLLGFWSCKPTQEDDQTLIVTTTGMLADVAKSIVEGSDIEVVSLMGPGVDPHLYKATQGDLKLLKQANLIIYNGLHLEGKMGEVLEKITKMPNKSVLAAAETIPKNQRIVLDEKNEIYDPHIWFDVALWQEVVNPILLEIQILQPENKELFEANANKKQQELINLHEWVKAQINTIPEEQRILITAHDAFAYFGQAYGVEVRGLQGISTLSEAGIKDVKALTDLIVNRKINAVFIESSVPVKSIEAVVEGAKDKGHEVTIGGTLFSDAMGVNGTPEGTYKGMVEHNVNTIVEALQ